MIAEGRGERQPTLTVGRAEGADLRIVGQRFDATGQDLIFAWKTRSHRARLGLIGGGMDEAVAKRTVADAFARHPLIAFKVPSMTVLLAALYGPADDPSGEPSLAGETTQNDSPEES